MFSAVPIRIPHLNRRPHSFTGQHLALGRKHAFMEYHQLIRKETCGQQTSGTKTTGSPLGTNWSHAGAMEVWGNRADVPQIAWTGLLPRLCDI